MFKNKNNKKKKKKSVVSGLAPHSQNYAKLAFEIFCNIDSLHF